MPISRETTRFIDKFLKLSSEVNYRSGRGSALPRQPVALASPDAGICQLKPVERKSILSRKFPSWNESWNEAQQAQESRRGPRLLQYRGAHTLHLGHGDQRHTQYLRTATKRK